MTDPFRAAVAAARLQAALATMAWQAAVVVPLRLRMFSSGAAPDAAEASRMVTEKLAAAAEGASAATRRALRGADAVSVAMAAIAPARRRVRANARRLASKL